jgi:hypothetical protein
LRLVDRDHRLRGIGTLDLLGPLATLLAPFLERLAVLPVTLPILARAFLALPILALPILALPILALPILALPILEGAIEAAVASVLARVEAAVALAVALVPGTTALPFERPAVARSTIARIALAEAALRPLAVATLAIGRPLLIRRTVPEALPVVVTIEIAVARLRLEPRLLVAMLTLLTALDLRHRGDRPVELEILAVLLVLLRLPERLL